MGPCQPDECNVHSAIPVKKLFSSITDLVEVINLNRMITWSNHTREKRHPVGDGDVVGSKCFDLYEDVCQLCRNCPLERLFQGGEGFSLERVVEESDGRQRRRWVRGYPIFDAKNRVVSVLKISFDIDTQREMLGRRIAETEEHEYGASERTARVTPFGETLSRRECEVLNMVAEGFSNRQIAALLQISANTVKSHVIHIFNKLGVNDRTHAAVLATRLKII